MAKFIRSFIAVIMPTVIVTMTDEEVMRYQAHKLQQMADGWAK